MRRAVSVVACKNVEARLLRVWNRYTQFTCFTGTKVQIRTLRVWSSNVQAEVELLEQSFES